MHGCVCVCDEGGCVREEIQVWSEMACVCVCGGWVVKWDGAGAVCVGVSVEV